MNSSKFFFLILVATLTIIPLCHLQAMQSTIVESEGYACMGEDRSRKQTENIALLNAKRNAQEKTLSYIESETTIKDFELKRDIVSAYSHGKVKILEEKKKEWYRDPQMGECFLIQVRAEVIPEEIRTKPKIEEMLSDPMAPLTVKLWTDKQTYRQGEKIKIFIRGNKPFYARIIHKDASGNTTQLLPNPFRENNYFNGGIVYEIPSGEDRFELEVTPPFGEESILIFAGTAPLGDIVTEAMGGVFSVKEREEEIYSKTRALKIKIKERDDKATPAEFYESKLTFRTAN
ncbi:MAG: DUF4384 domain-containing protein [Syntrophales bacterium]|nr:DUF4384 domain-containing protein [Syntrophales bacterium]